MRLTVNVRPGARTEKVEKLSDDKYRVWVKAPAREGKANEALIRLLADHFDRPQSAIRLLHGASSRRKVVEIL